MTTEDPEALRCYPGTSRPADWVTLPQFAAAEGRRLLAERRKQQFSTRRMRSALTKVLGGFPRPTPLDAHMTTVDGIPRRLAFAPEPGLTLSARLDLQPQPAPIALLLDPVMGILGLAMIGRFVFRHVRETRTRSRWGIGVGWLAARQWGWSVGLAAGFSGPLFGFAAVRFLERFDRLVGGTRGVLLALTGKRRFLRLLAERQAISDELLALADEYGL